MGAKRVTGTVAGGIVLAVAGVLLRRRLARFAVSGHSMEPGLEEGDYLVVRRSAASHHRGDVVIFAHPSRPELHLIKRVVALPGEEVAIAGGQVHVAGAPLAEPWADGPTLGDGNWSLGPSEVLVLNDNRAHSGHDSRDLGPIPTEQISWRAIYRYWPPSRAGRPASLLVAD